MNKPKELKNSEYIRLLEKRCKTLMSSKDKMLKACKKDIAEAKAKFLKRAHQILDANIKFSISEMDELVSNEAVVEMIEKGLDNA